MDLVEQDGSAPEAGAPTIPRSRPMRAGTRRRRSTARPLWCW